LFSQELGRGIFAAGAKQTEKRGFWLIPRHVHPQKSLLELPGCIDFDDK